MEYGRNPTPKVAIAHGNTFSYPLTKKISLPKPAKNIKESFQSVIEKRRSGTGTKSPSLQQISSLLWHAAKVSTVITTDHGVYRTHRPAPSAGAIHAIDVLVSLPASLPRRQWMYYHPYTHDLFHTDCNIRSCTKMFKLINNCVLIRNAVVIWFMGDVNAVEKVYENPLSLLWRDAGALLLMFQLVATSLDMLCCPVGTLAEPDALQIFNTNTLISAGGIILTSNAK